jgi:NAD(P)-dependent dehydrogenase (short-subunit alcohol dehydrogenase family)
MSSVALVTGGSRGIGLATVRRLLEDGHRVCFCGRDEEAGRAAEAELGGDARFVRADVGREREVEALVETCARELGPPRILVNNAGVNARHDAASMTEHDWDAFFAIDLKAAWLCAKHVLPHMRAATPGGRAPSSAPRELRATSSPAPRERGASSPAPQEREASSPRPRERGAIVNVSSIHAVATLPGFFPYAAAKAGLTGLTRSLALDYGPHGIRVNCVCPGFTDTRLVRDRIADPAEIAATIAFLASPEASYVTGATLFVDGGLTARRAG